MTKTPVGESSWGTRDRLLLRLSIVVGGVLIALFMIGDLQLVPAELSDFYFANRAYFQLPIVAALLAFTFHRQFPRYAQTAFLITILSLTYLNYYLIHVAWKTAEFSFPYEGTLLYGFFGFFVLGMAFRYALWLMILSSLGFVLLMALEPVYGDRTFMNVGFVAGSLFVGVIGRHHIDRLVGKLREANEQLVVLSTEDPLTELLNRRALMAESERLFALQRRSGQGLAVLMMDLDHFKQFNDRYGHQAGDQAIRCQADIMSQVFKRQTDILGRYGGEEFIVVVEAPDSDSVAALAAEVLDQWKARAIANEDSPASRFLSCSIGICQGPASDFGSVEEMIRRADDALYQAKKAGRGQYVMALAEPQHGSQ